MNKGWGENKNQCFGDYWNKIEQGQGRNTFKRRDRHVYRLRTKPRGKRTVEDSRENSDIESPLYTHML